MMSINLNQLGTKAKSKNEMYRILTVEAKNYLPPQKEWTIYFIRDVFQGKKKVKINTFQKNYRFYMLMK